MPLTSELMGLGMSAPLASKMGYPMPQALAGTGTAQLGATPLAGGYSYVAPAAGATAYAFTTSAPLTKIHPICNPTAVAGIVYPPPGGSINGGAVNAGFTIPANSLVIATQATAGQWFCK